MNIPPHIPQVVVNSAAPATESLAKANAMKEVVPPTVKPEAIVPQKSREQDVRPPINQPSVSTYEGIQSSRHDDQIIPESDEQPQGEQDSEQEKESSQNNAEQANQNTNDQSDDDSTSSESPSINNDSNNTNNSDSESDKQIQKQEQQQIQQLQQRDNEVKAHEQAHAAIGGTHAGTPNYEYQTGPNGQKYAVGGEVSIDVSKEATPEATIRKMQTVQAAALAPAEPSSQDRKVAAQASRNIADARAEMVQQNALASSSSTGTSNGEIESDKSALESTVNSLAENENNSDVEYPNKMDLAKEVEQDNNSHVFENKTAQVISNKYATATVPHEQGFSAVA